MAGFDVGAWLSLLDEESLALLVERDLSLWGFVVQSEECRPLLNVYRIFRSRVDLGGVDVSSVLAFAFVNRPDLYRVLSTSKGLEWLGWNLREIVSELEKI